MDYDVLSVEVFCVFAFPKLSYLEIVFTCSPYVKCHIIYLYWLDHVLPSIMTPIMLHQEETNYITLFNLIRLNCVEKWLIVVQDVNCSFASCCSEQALYAFGIACARRNALSDIVTVYVNKEAVIVFIPFYFCNKNVILFSHNSNKVV